MAPEDAGVLLALFWVEIQLDEFLAFLGNRRPLPITFVIYGGVCLRDYSEHMTLSSMVVSRDWQEISVLECILGSLQIGVDIQSQPEMAWAKLCKSGTDALIVDCDLRGAHDFLRQLQESKDRGNAIPVLIVGGTPKGKGLRGTSAALTFEKPLSVEQALRTLSAARILILERQMK